MFGYSPEQLRRIFPHYTRRTDGWVYFHVFPPLTGCEWQTGRWISLLWQPNGVSIWSGLKDLVLALDCQRTREWLSSSKKMDESGLSGVFTDATATEAPGAQPMNSGVELVSAEVKKWAQDEFPEFEGASSSGNANTTSEQTIESPKKSLRKGTAEKREK